MDTSSLQVSVEPLPNGEHAIELVKEQHVTSDEPHPDHTDTTDIVAVKMIHPNLWSKFKDDTGFVDIEPYQTKWKTTSPVYVKQYPLSYDKEIGIQPIIDNFLAQGVLIPIHSQYNTSINPVAKADLRAINQLIIPLAQVGPEEPTIMNSIPCTH